MKLLRDSVLLRALLPLLAGRGTAVRATFTVTVPAPLARSPLAPPVHSNVVQLDCRSGARARAPSPSRHHADALTPAGHLAVVSSR